MWVTGEIDQMFILSDLRSPDIGRGKREKPNDWLGPQNGSGVPFPSAEVKDKKGRFLSKARGRRTIAILLRAKDQRLTETWETRVPQTSTKNRTTSSSLWKKKILQWNPVENKISNFGDIFPLHSNFVYHSLSLSIWRRTKVRKDIYIHGLSNYMFWHSERIYIYIYNRSKEPMYFHFTMWSMLLLHAFFPASIRLMLSCLELSY